MELGLVCDRSGQRRGAVVVPGDGEVAQPGGPVVVEVALDPELVGQDGRNRPAPLGAGRPAADWSSDCGGLDREGARPSAVTAAVFRWSRHREMPRPIRAMPVGTASGLSNECGSTCRASVAKVPRTRSPEAQRARTRARNSAMPKRTPPARYPTEERGGGRLHQADVARDRAAGPCGEDVVDVAGRECARDGST